MDDIDHQRLLDQLIRVEGLTLHPRRDSEGNLVIGVGRNLDRVGVTRGEAVMLLEGDVRRVTRELQENLPSFQTLDVVASTGAHSLGGQHRSSWGVGADSVRSGC
jgi:hypothetical protein